MTLIKLLLAELIAAGNYDWVNPDITPEHFKVESNGTDSQLVTVHLGRGATTDEVLAEIDRCGLKPARIEHLLCFGAIHPEEQRQHRIVCLGSSWLASDGYRRFPSLDENEGERELDLEYDFDKKPWHHRCRFLAIEQAA